MLSKENKCLSITSWLLGGNLVSWKTKEVSKGEEMLNGQDFSADG